MRVIEYGHIKPKQIKCSNCGCILEYVPKDLKTYTTGYYILCPICDKRIVTDNDGKELIR